LKPPHALAAPSLAATAALAPKEGAKPPAGVAHVYRARVVPGSDSRRTPLLRLLSCVDAPARAARKPPRAGKTTDAGAAGRDRSRGGAAGTLATRRVGRTDNRACGATARDDSVNAITQVWPGRLESALESKVWRALTRVHTARMTSRAERFGWRGRSGAGPPSLHGLRLVGFRSSQSRSRLVRQPPQRKTRRIARRRRRRTSPPGKHGGDRAARCQAQTRRRGQRGPAYGGNAGAVQRGKSHL
jgi:hypothetical protein